MQIFHGGSCSDEHKFKQPEVISSSVHYITLQLTLLQSLQSMIESKEQLDCVSDKQWQNASHIKDMDLRYVYFKQYKVLYSNLIPRLKQVLESGQYNAYAQYHLVDSWIKEFGLKTPEKIHIFLEHLKEYQEIYDDDIIRCELQSVVDSNLFTYGMTHLSYQDAKETLHTHIERGSKNIKLLMHSIAIEDDERMTAFNRFSRHRPLPTRWVQFLSSSYNDLHHDIVKFPVDIDFDITEFSKPQASTRESTIEHSLLFDISYGLFTIEERQVFFINMLRDLYLYGLSCYTDDCDFLYAYPDGIATSFDVFLVNIPEHIDDYFCLESQIHERLLRQMFEEKKSNNKNEMKALMRSLEKIVPHDVVSFLLSREIKKGHYSVTSSEDRSTRKITRKYKQMDDFSARMTSKFMSDSVNTLGNLFGVQSYHSVISRLKEKIPTVLIDIVILSITRLKHRILHVSEAQISTLAPINHSFPKQMELFRAYHERQLLIENSFMGHFPIPGGSPITLSSIYHFCQLFFVDLVSHANALVVFRYLGIDERLAVVSPMLRMYDDVILTLKHFIESVLYIIIDVFIHEYEIASRSSQHSYQTRQNTHLLWDTMIDHLVKPIIDFSVQDVAMDKKKCMSQYEKLYSSSYKSEIQQTNHFRLFNSDTHSAFKIKRSSSAP